MNYEYKLSICMMVRDEESNIKRCLDSLKPIVKNEFAELIVIDTGSKDSTPNIVKNYTDKLYYHAWNDNFSDMRNVSISYAKGEWIFIIDADERLDDPQGFIELFSKTDINKFNTIQLFVKNLYSIKDENNYNQNISPRIFKNDGSFCYQGSVHNQPVMKGPYVNFDISLTHYGYISNDKQLMEKKYKRTVALLKKELQINPNNIYYLYQLGVSYDMHNDHSDALRELKKAYELLSIESISTRKNYINVYGSYIRAAYTNKEYEDVIKIGTEALALNNEYIDIYYILSLAAKQTNDKKALIRNCLEYARLSKIFNSLSISKDYSIIIYHIDNQSRDFIYTELALYYLDENQIDMAYDYAMEITNKTRNIYLTIKILIKKSNFASLKKYYLDKLEDEQQKESFLCTLEEEIKILPDDGKFELFREFSCIDDIYGIFCRYRIDPSLGASHVKLFDFNKLPLFYVEILLSLRNSIKALISVLKPLNILKIRNIINYLIEKDVEFYNAFYEYLQYENIRPTDIQSNKTYIAIAAVILLNNSENNDQINETYYNIFKLYIDRGIDYVSQLYQIHKSRIIYNDIINEEDRFFILMYIVKDYLSKNNFKLAVKYLIEALQSNKYMSKYIELYKNEIIGMDIDKKTNLEEKINES